MGRAINFNVSQFMDTRGEISVTSPPERLTAAFLRGIVAWVTTRQATIPMITNITCRHVRPRKMRGIDCSAHYAGHKQNQICLPGVRRNRKDTRMGKDSLEHDGEESPGEAGGQHGPSVYPLTREKPGLPLELGRLGPIEKEILDYLRRYPRASDTVEGITRYWLEGGEDAHGDFEVQEALENLERNGLISVRAGPSDRKTYTVNTKRNN